ncbi:hypothetical protein [Marivivens aquimaris]|uniref:hypothetical protein n=1 Tax=Marivivens aquimaris TaxID=2774876 RepID=UPI00187DF190|nr:hypothetical protein [Marivivens aquimaris]
MPNNSYSQFVSYAKVILPLASLALLSTLFLFARTNSDVDTIPYAEIEDIASKPRLAGPNISGVTVDGDTFAVSAKVARPLEDSRAFAVEQIAINLQTGDGRSVNIGAGVGEVDTSSRLVNLHNLVRLDATDGYLMETQGLNADLDAGTVESIAPLEVRAPYGALTAGHLSITRGSEGAHIVFNQGVRLVYQPQQ